jgi:hypothetical protein
MFALAQQGVKSIEQQRLLDKTDSAVEKSRKLVLRCYNMIASHQEVTGVQVASYLMNYGDHYTTHTFRNLFLISIEKYLQSELSQMRASHNFDDDNSEGRDYEINPLIVFVILFSKISDVLDGDLDEVVKDADEQFLLESTETENGGTFVMVNTRLDYQYRSKDLQDLSLYDFVCHFHKKIIDKSDRNLMKNINSAEGQRLFTDGSKMSERHSFAKAHPQSASHIMIKHTISVVPIVIGPQIPRCEREETRERYCRALLTLFIPWRTVNDLCAFDETWSEAFEIRKSLLTAGAVKIIDNIQLLHECKSDRDEHLHQIIAEGQTDDTIDPAFIPTYRGDDEDDPDNNPEELLQMLSLVSEATTAAFSASLTNQEQRYMYGALDAINKTDRFIPTIGKLIIA